MNSLFLAVKKHSLVRMSAPFFLLAVASCSDSAALQAASQDDHHHGSHQWTEFKDGLGFFVDYAPPAQGRKAQFHAHVTELSTGSPLEGVRVVFDVMKGEQVSESLSATVEETPGYASVEGFLGAGERQVRVRLSGARDAEFGPFALLVHADSGAADDEAHALDAAGHGDEISFSVEQQWTARLRTSLVGRRDLAARIAVAGEFVTPPHAKAILTSTFSGRLLPAPESSLPRLGDFVQEGQLLAILEVPLSSGDLAALRANSFAWHEHEHELLLREFDLDAQEVTARQDLELAKTEIQFAQTRLERVDGLFRRELATASERELAEQTLREAELHQLAAESLLETLAEIRQGLAALRSEHAQDAKRVEAMRVELRAPIAGVLSESLPVEGSSVEAGQELGVLVNPNELWLTVHVPEVHAARAAGSADVQLRLTSRPEDSWELFGELGGELVHRAPELDPRTRTLPLHYALSMEDEKGRAFWAGMFADVLFATDEVEQAIAIPSDAVVQQDGLSVAFVQLGGETFEKRVLELGVRDGDWVEVRSGLDFGDRVVTSGAYLVRLASSAPDSFGDGHVH